MTNIIYILWYIHTDKVEYSEILGVYSDKNKAIDKLLEKAHYRKDKNGNLTQYMEKSNDYRSYEELKSIVTENLELKDEDIYRITEKCID